MRIEKLVDRGVEPQLVDLWKAQGIQELTPCQQSVFTSDPIWEGSNLIIVAPTSAGKTFTGEVLAAQAALSLQRAIFLVPFKAIAEEKYAEFQEKYRSLGVSIVISDGDHSEHDHDIRMGNFGLAVIVYEKLAQLLVQSPGIFADCQLLVVDEIQLVGDQGRGPTLEVLLTHVLQQQESPQIIGLSATLDDLGGLEKWLKAEVIVHDGRPVPLWESVAWPYGTEALVNVESESAKDGPNLAASRPPPTLDAGSKEELVYRLIASEGFDKSYLLFRTRVDDTISTAQGLAYVLPVDPVPGTVRDRIAELEDTAVRAFLEQWVDRRVAYHNSGLSLEERRLTEQLYREGILRILVTTSTLAAGVNTPADIVGILDYRRWDQTKQSNVSIPVAEYKNSVGRAGRFGISPEGRSYILALKSTEYNLLSRNFIQGRPVPLRSAMPKTSDPKVLVLGVVARGLAKTREDIRDAFENSFAYGYYFVNSSEADEFLVAMVEAVGDLLNEALLADENGGLIVTPLGRVAAASGLSISSFSKLVELMQSPRLIHGKVDSLFEEICRFEEMQSHRPYNNEDRAELLKEWINGNPVGEIAERHSNRYAVGHGNIRNIGATASWILRTAEQSVDHIALAAHGDQLKHELGGLASRCLFGVTTEMVPIASLRTIRRSEVMQLRNNAQGKRLTSLHEILDASPEEFVGVLSPQRLGRLKSAIESRIGESLRRLRVGHLNRADKVVGLRPLMQRVYDCTGEEFERALEDLLTAEPFNLKARRFTQQRTGQPDLEITGAKGTIVLQATASVDGYKPINWNKARDVTSSVGYSGVSSNFVCVGRPEFHDVAVGNANEIADRGSPNLLLMPLPALAELCLREAEGEVSPGTVLGVLEIERGHYSLPQSD